MVEVSIPYMPRYLSIRPIVPTTSKLPPLNCPACGRQLLLEGLPHDLRLRCPGCDAGLMIGFKRDWLYAPICFAGGLVIAYAQGLRNLELVICTVIYSGALVFLAAPLLGRFFPLKLKLAREYFQTLRIPPNEKRR